MTLHSALTGDKLHVPGYFVGSDPGAVGAGKYWVDTSSGPPYQLYVRKADDSAWEAIGVVSAAPPDATFVVGAANGSLSAELVLGSAVIMRGVAGSRPAAGTAGRIYIATDTNIVSRDNGSTWDNIILDYSLVSGGPSLSADFVTLSTQGSLSAEAVLGTAVIMQGVIASRPAFGTAGRLYYATDTDILSKDTGSAWQDIGFKNPMTTAGDLIIGGASGAPTRLAVGSNGHVLTVSAGSPAWAAPTPSDAKYVVTEANGSLSAEKVLPYLADYNPLIPPASPDAFDDEFADSSLDGSWTSIGSPDSISESTYPGGLYVEDNDGANAGVRKAFAPGGTDFTVAACVRLAMHGAFSFVAMITETSAPADICTCGVQAVSLSSMNSRSATGGTATNIALGGSGYNLGERWFFLIQRTSGNVYTNYVSRDGINWIQIGSFTNAGTIATLALVANGQGSAIVSAYWEFVRYFPGVITKTIGRTP